MKKFYYLNLILILCFLVLTAGCVHRDAANRQKMDKIMVGQSAEDLRKLMGEPDFRLKAKEGKTIYFYQVKQKNYQDSLSMENCMPVLIDNNQVASIGSEFSDNWDVGITSQTAQGSQHKENLQKEAMQAELEKKNAELVALKIEKLEAKVRPIPSSNYELNLKYYKELLSLAPDDVRYQKKVKYYQSKMSARKKVKESLEKEGSDKEITQENLDDKSSSGSSDPNTLQIKTDNIRLYKGNSNIELALRKLSVGTLYVWVKNVSSEPIGLAAENYHLLDRTRETIQCTPSAGLTKELPAGEITHGQLKYKASEDLQLGEMVFDHSGAGKITRVFP